MAVTSGSCYSSYAKNTRFRVDWERTGTWSDNSGCGSIIKWKLVLENGNYWYSNAIKCYAIYINGTKVSDGGTWSNYTSSGNYTLIDWQSNVRIAHNNAGNEKTFNINYTGWFYSSYNVSASTDFTLPSIPRGTSITSFTASKRNETSLTLTWKTADAIAEVYYSTNNGKNWKKDSATNVSSGTITASELSPNTTYQCKLKVVRNTIETFSSQVSATTYAAPTQSLRSKTETSITMNWACDSTASQIRYSSNNGTSWSNWINVSGQSGTYTISGLSANTPYNIKTEVKRSATSTSYQTSVSAQTTYNYPYCTEAPSFTIGNNLTVKFYNPLNRTISIRMWSHVSQAFVTDAINVTGTTYTFTPNANTLYASIPNNTSSVYNIDVTYSGNKYVKTGGSYSVNTSACTPTFTNFAYKDTTDNLLTQAIDNNQVIVQNVSNVNVVISSANKMVAKNSATASKYQALFSNLSKTFNYSASDIDTNLGVPTGSGNSTFKVTAYDSRNIAKEVSKTINIVPYSAPIVNVSLNRLNNFEAETHLKLSGTFSRVTINNVDKNAIQQIQYRYKETSASTWGSWTAMTIQSQGNGSYQTTQVTLSLDNTKQFTFEFQVTDGAKTTSASQVLSIGQPLMFLHTNGQLELNGEAGLVGTLDVHSIDLALKHTHATTGKAIGFGVGGGGTNRGIWDFVQQKWMIYDNDSNIYLNKFTRIPGAAEDKPLMVRGIAGCDGTATTAGELHLNYGVDAPVKIGKDATTYVQASGMIRGTQAGSWVKDRDNSLVRNAYNGNGAYAPVICQGTMNGTWTVGCLSGENSLTFNYETDTKYNNNDNTANRWTIGTNGNYSGKALNVTQVKSLSSKSHSGYGTNNGYLPDMSFIAYWNGAYNSSGNSNLTYAHQGTIQCKPTSLYDNNTGTTGTITLSQTVANFTYVDVFYSKNGDTAFQSVRVYTGHTNNLNSISCITGYLMNGMSVQINATIIKLSGTSLTHVYNGGVNLYTNPSIGVFTGNELQIKKVVGWKC